ncbi:MAG: sensor histidine kinase [Deltaproteobacteria bacterium]|nr:MAG: sensor histidine kinase [Deltaproteobacteria bacterium]
MNALASAVESREDEIDGRMQVVQQLSSMVAHEVRNPLQSLSLLASLARTEPDRDAQAEQLALIEDEIRVLEGVVQRFLSNSGPLRIARSQTDLVKVLERAASIAYPRAAQNHVRLLVQAPARLDVYADGSLVRRALENLMLNAIEFAGKGRSRRSTGQVVASIQRDDDRVVLIVEDDGPGVPYEDRERIFQPYMSSKAGGTGLGLALVRQVFDAHGGYIRCEPSPLGGARFVATIPLQPSLDGDA